MFHLSEEDVHAFVTNDKLRKALVPVEKLYITGEIGEGIDYYKNGSSQLRSSHNYFVGQCIPPGAFGRVFKGLLQVENTMNDGKRIILPVAIKTIKS